MIGTPQIDQRHGGRQGEEQRQLQTAVLRAHRLRVLAAAELVRNGRKRTRAEADADQPQRQLVQPVGKIDVRNRTVRQQLAGERGRDEEVELDRASAAAAGPISFISRFTSGIDGRPLQVAAGRGSPGRLHSQASCSAPPTVTEIAWYRVVFSGSSCGRTKRATICATLSRIGAAAATQNL